MTSQRPAPGSPPALGERTDEQASAPAPARPAWVSRRLFPLLGVLGLLAIGYSSTVWWGPRLVGRTAWALPNDLWGTLIAANRLLHGDLAGLYAPPTGLITFPGGAIILRCRLSPAIIASVSRRRPVCARLRQAPSTGARRGGSGSYSPPRAR